MTEEAMVNASMVGRVVGEQRRAREMALAYRIAAARMGDLDVAAHLQAYEQTFVRLAGRLASAVELDSGVRADLTWLRVGALDEGAAILATMLDLEGERADAFDAIVKVLPRGDELRNVFERAWCASQARQCWLEEHAESLRRAESRGPRRDRPLHPPGGRTRSRAFGRTRPAA